LKLMLKKCRSLWKFLWVLAGSFLQCWLHAETCGDRMNPC
jgi:hypothetical protein